jgi:anti-sigma factor RsiW
MNERESSVDDLHCIEFVQLMTAYLDDEVRGDQRRRIEEHLQGCEGCSAALEQLRTVIGVTGRLSAADVAGIDPLIRDRLMATLRKPRRR